MNVTYSSRPSTGEYYEYIVTADGNGQLDKAVETQRKFEKEFKIKAKLYSNNASKHFTLTFHTTEEELARKIHDVLSKEDL